jgi:Helix-turn-helix domain
MEQGFRRGFTTAEKTELWDRWQRGESLKAIGRAFGKQSSSIYFQISPHGGIRPAPRRRSRLALTLSEREEISRGIAVRRSARSMAGLLGRSPSTVSREISRNGGYDGYRAALADDKAWTRTRRPKRCKLATNAWLRQAVASKLRLNWAPEQIAGWLKRAHPEDGCYQVSHETIYRSLFVQARGVLKKELLCHLRSKRTIRRSKQAGLISDGRGQIKDQHQNAQITSCRTFSFSFSLISTFLFLSSCPLTCRLSSPHFERQGPWLADPWCQSERTHLRKELKRPRP